ncbi:MAG: DUF2752 domain-containing protein [Clostridia bacterium]|nr:DUF2752 domain-containing protein [Clostridia bacterium]
MSVNKIKFSQIRLIIYIISIVVIIFLLNGKISTHCYWNEKYGFFCPTCGLTRATINIFRFNFIEAAKYNFFYTCILAPFIIILVINDIYIIAKRAVMKGKELSFIEILLGENE